MAIRRFRIPVWFFQPCTNTTGTAYVLIPGYYRKNSIAIGISRISIQAVMKTGEVRDGPGKPGKRLVKDAGKITRRWFSSYRYPGELCYHTLTGKRNSTDAMTTCRPALLIIDMQNDFIREGAPLQMPGAPPIIGNVTAVLDIFRRRNLPVIHIVRVHRRDGSDVEIFRQELFTKIPFAVEGSPGADIIKELTPLPGEYLVRKTRMSAFLFTDLDLLLRSLGIGEVFIAGIQTPNCIRTTAFDAMAYNYPTYLIEDAVAAQNHETHQANCRDMSAIGIRMVRTAAVSNLLGRWNSTD
jgi:nicotinamidase-related amidase